MLSVPPLVVVARARTDFPSKFGLPRQSGLAPSLRGEIVFEKPFRNPDYIRGLEGFSHIWLIWQFSENLREGYSATVRPPRLGGNTRLGVFATRSPFRPNPLGLSCAKLEALLPDTKEGPVLRVSGLDLMDGTPIFDIKPYLPFADSHPEAADGFAGERRGYRLRVSFPEELLNKIPAEARPALLEALSEDPRPSYQNNPARRYGFPCAGFDIRFSVNGDLLTVTDAVKLP